MNTNDDNIIHIPRAITQRAEGEPSRIIQANAAGEVVADPTEAPPPPKPEDILTLVPFTDGTIYRHAPHPQNPNMHVVFNSANCAVAHTPYKPVAELLCHATYLYVRHCEAMQARLDADNRARTAVGETPDKATTAAEIKDASPSK